MFLPGKPHGYRCLVGYSPWGYRESGTTEHTHSTSCLVLVCLHCWFWGHLLASVYYELFGSLCQGLAYLYSQHLMRLTLSPVMCRDQCIFESEPFTKYFCSNRSYLHITDERYTEGICLLFLIPQPSCSSSNHHCWFLRFNSISPFKFRYLGWWYYPISHLTMEEIDPR